jgi:TolA-binding protein
MRILIFVLLCSYFLEGVSQTNSILKSKVEFCASEVERLEGKVEKYEGLLDTQNKLVIELKQEIMSLRDDKKQLEYDKSELLSISVSLLHLAMKFEEEGKYEEAMQLYKLLIKSYPSSLEASASRLKVQDIKEDKKKKR